MSFSLISLLASVVSVAHSINAPKDVYGTMKATQEVYDQTLDHFNAYNSDTFQQRWFYNDSLWSGPDNMGPIIFQAGGIINIVSI